MCVQWIQGPFADNFMCDEIQAPPAIPCEIIDGHYLHFVPFGFKTLRMKPHTCAAWTPKESYGEVLCPPSYDASEVDTEVWVGKSGGQYRLAYSEESYERVGGGFTAGLPIQGVYGTYVPGGHVWQVDATNQTKGEFLFSSKFAREEGLIDDSGRLVQYE
jgi:hypothetical protein